MFKDIIEICDFIIEQIDQNKIGKKKCIDIYDTYRILDKLSDKSNLVISYLSREVNYHDTQTSFGTPENKWLFFVNKQIQEYEDLKYRFFSTVTRLDNADNYPEFGVFEKNFVNKSLNGKIDEYTTITNINKDFKFSIYRVNFLIKNCPEYRSFCELFSKTSINIRSKKIKSQVIEELKLDNIAMCKIIKVFENILKDRCSISSLLVNN